MKKRDFNSFKLDADIIHSNKYLYYEDQYKGTQIKIPIKCPIHGIFWQKPSHHLSGIGCPKCGINKRSKNRIHTLQNFISESIKVHGYKYDYSQAMYKTAKIPLKIYCGKHGYFYQQPNHHLSGSGCFKCYQEYSSMINTKSFDKFEVEANVIHANKYKYIEDSYSNSFTYTDILCEQHGLFKQTPANHLKGQGCPKCKESKLEKEVRKILTDNNINFEQQKRFDWLGRQSLDFYIPDYQVAIECQGIQHFESVEYFGGNNKLSYTQNCDKRKFNLCTEYNIKLIYFSNSKYKNKHNFIFTNSIELLKFINNIFS